MHVYFSESVLQVVLDKTLCPVSGRYRGVRSGDESQRSRLSRGVFRVLRLRRGAVQGRLFRRPRWGRFLSTGLRATETQGHVRTRAHVQSAEGGQPPLAVRAQGQAAEEKE